MLLETCSIHQQKKTRELSIKNHQPFLDPLLDIKKCVLSCAFCNYLVIVLLMLSCQCVGGLPLLSICSWSSFSQYAVYLKLFILAALPTYFPFSLEALVMTPFLFCIYSFLILSISVIYSWAALNFKALFFVRIIVLASQVVTGNTHQLNTHLFMLDFYVTSL